MNESTLCYGNAAVEIMLHDSKLNPAMIIRCAVNAISMEFINLNYRYIPLIKRIILRNSTLSICYSVHM